MRRSTRRGAAARSLLAALILVMCVSGSPARADSLDAPVLKSPAAGSTTAANPTFRWDPVSRASRYFIEVSKTAAFSATDVVYDETVFGTSATPTTELPLGTLHWRVRTLDGIPQAGQFSASQSFTREPAAAPGLTGPADEAVLSYPGDPAVLSWSPLPAIKEYVVEVDDEDSFNNPAHYRTAATSLALPTMLPSNSPRYWRVQGVSTDQGVTTAWSSVSDLRSFSIAWPGTTRPTLLTPTDAIDVDIDEIEFTWTAVPGAAKYRIELSTSPAFPDDAAFTQTAITSATRYRHTASLEQDQYYWRVKALNPAGDPTEYSAVSSFKREWLDGEGEQARPTVVLEDHDAAPGVQLQRDRLYFSWTPIRRASHYEIEFLNGDGVRLKCKSPHAHFTPYEDGGKYTGTAEGVFGGCDPFENVAWMEPGGPFQVRVRAVDRVTPTGLAERTTLWSDFAREGEVAPPKQFFDLLAVPASDALISEPAQITASPNAEGSPRLSWNRVEGASGYVVWLARDSGFNTIVGRFGTKNTEFVINQALLDNLAGQPYHWFVLPCAPYAGLSNPATRCVPESEAVNIPGRFATFNKIGKPVAGLAAAPVQTDTVALSWHDHHMTSPDGSGVQWYEVEVRNAANAVVDSVKTDATGYSPIDESYPDGTYTWQVRAIDAAGTEQSWSETRSFEKRSSAPVPLTPQGTVGQPVLRWTPTAFAGSYDVEVYRGVDAEFPPGSKVAAASTTGLRYPSWVPTVPLAAQDTYSFRVRQVDAYGRPGPWSTQVVPFTIGATAPQNQSPAPGADVPVPDLLFDWTEVPGAVTYRYEVSTTDGFGGALFDTATTVSTRYAPLKAFAGGTTYHWRVSARDAAGNTLATSTPTSFKALAAPGRPTAGAKTVGAQIQVTWTVPVNGGSPLTGYIVRYRKQGTSSWTETTTQGDVQQLTFGNLDPNTLYEAEVAAQNAIGIGAFSNRPQVKTPTVPGPVSNLVLTPAVRAMSAGWNPPSVPSGGLPLTGYVVRVTPPVGPPSEQKVTTNKATISDLADETTYTVEVAAENDIGRGSFVAAQSSTPPLPGPPQTSIITGPPHNGSINQTSATFSFTASSGSGTTYECRVDEGAFAPCTSPKQITGLGEGSHTFEARGRDQYGQLDTTPAQRTFAVDLTAPDTALDSAPAPASGSSSATFEFSSENGSTFECKLDTGGWSACTSPRQHSGLAEGDHTFSVRAKDSAANVDPSPATHTWTIDTSPPQTVLDSGPSGTAGSASAQFGFSSEAGATFQCRLDAGAYEPCSAPKTLSGLADGSHTFYVRAVDALGNVDPTPAIRTWAVDATAPQTALAGSGPSGTVKSTAADFAFSSEPGATFECKLDDAAYAACTSPKSLTGLTDGEHTFTVRARDAAGNVDGTPESRTWRVDTGAPQTVIDTGPSGTVRTANTAFTFSSEAGATYECKLDGGAWAGCTSPRELSALTDGEHSFSVRATDAVGNVDATPAVRTWRVDSTAPQTQIDSGPTGPTASAAASFAFTSEPGATFECKLDAAEFAPCTTPAAYSALADGTHSFAVRAVDGAGNADASPATRTWVVDTAAPDTAISTAPATITTDTSATFTYAGTPAADVNQFECRVDGGSFGACPSNGKGYSALAVGSHTFEVRAVDAAGNADASPAAHAWTVNAPAAQPTPTPSVTPAPTPAPSPGPGTTPPPSDEPSLADALAGLPRTVTSSRGGRSFSLKLPAGALASGTALSVKTAVGSGTATVVAGRATTVTIRLSAKGRRSLKRKRKLKLALAATATGPSGAKATGSRSLTLKLRR